MDFLKEALRAKQISTAAVQCTAYTREAVIDMVTDNPKRRAHMAQKHTAETYSAAAAELEAAAARMDSAMIALMDSERATTEKAKQAIGRAKDSAAQRSLSAPQPRLKSWQSWTRQASWRVSLRH